MTEHDALLVGLADRIGERMVGTRKPAHVRTTETRVDREGEASVRLVTDLGTIVVTLRREQP